MNFSIINLETVDSTNNYLKRLLQKDSFAEGTIVASKKQLDGKGQQGNSWESEANKNLTFSIFLKPNLLAENMFIISKLISISIVEALSKHNIETSIKWPNDIYFNDSKLGGILIENQLIGSKIKHSIIGVGINVNQLKFVSDAPNPVSIANIIGQEVNVEVVLESILNQLNVNYSQFNEHEIDQINKSYFKHLFRKKNYHKYIANDNTFEARIKHIANDGELILETKNNKTLSFYFKEVEFVIDE